MNTTIGYITGSTYVARGHMFGRSSVQTNLGNTFEEVQIDDDKVYRIEEDDSLFVGVYRGYLYRGRLNKELANLLRRQIRCNLEGLEA